jgi:[protein-PII] uridylyltransferase
MTLKTDLLLDPKAIDIVNARPARTGKSKKTKQNAPNALSGQARRARLREDLQRRTLPGIGADEIEAHFLSMPAHYWDHVDENDLRWGLQTIHGFLECLTSPKASPTRPFVDWREALGTATIQVMLCTWDRQGLLAKAAASFSAAGLNILQADVFTRTDNLVLDRFSVIPSDERTIDSAARLKEVSFLLEGALSEPPRFASVWACSRHKLLASAATAPIRVEFDNATPSASTLVQVQAPDRLGLLYDLLQTMADSSLNVTQAIIQTDSGTAHDTIYIRNADGQKIADPEQLDELRRKLETALN